MLENVACGTRKSKANGVFASVKEATCFCRKENEDLALLSINLNREIRYLATLVGIVTLPIVAFEAESSCWLYPSYVLTFLCSVDDLKKELLE